MSHTYGEEAAAAPAMPSRRHTAPTATAASSASVSPSAHADYALLLTYIPAGMRVRATPAVRLATMTRDAANVAGVRRSLPVHRGPDAPPPAATRGISAAGHGGAAQVLELDIAPQQLMALTQMQPHLMQACKSAAAGAAPVSALVSAADKSSFIELVLSQLRVRIGRGEQYSLVFEPLPHPQAHMRHAEEDFDSAASSRYGTPGASPHHGSAARAAAAAASTAATPARRSSSRAHMDPGLAAGEAGASAGSGAGAGAGAGAGDDRERFFNDMIPPEVALAARSETPLKPRSPMHQRSRSMGIPSVSGSARAAAAAAAAAGSTAPAAAAAAAQPNSHSHAHSQRFIFSPPHRRGESPGAEPLPRDGPPSPAAASPLAHAHAHGHGQGLAPAHPEPSAHAHANVSALWAEVVALRRENSEANARAQSLQTQLDAAAASSGSAAHAAEVRSLRRALEDSRAAKALLEDRLAHAQIKRGAPSSAEAGGGGQGSTDAERSEEESRDLVQSLSSQLSHSQSLASSFARSLAALQEQVRSLSAEVQREFVAAGHALRGVHALATREAALALKLSGAGAPSPPAAAAAAAASGAAIPPQHELDQSFSAEHELLASPEPLPRIGGDPALLAGPALSLQSLELLLAEGRAVEQRFHFLVECVQQRNQLIRASAGAAQASSARVHREVEALLAHAQSQAQTHPTAAEAEATEALASSAEKLAQLAGEKALLEAQRNREHNDSRASLLALEEECAARDRQVAALERQVSLLQRSAAASADAASTDAAEASAAASEELARLREENRSLRESRSTAAVSLASSREEHAHLARDNARMESIIAQAREQVALLSAKLEHFEGVTVPTLARENQALLAELLPLRERADALEQDLQRERERTRGLESERQREGSGAARGSSADEQQSHSALALDLATAHRENAILCKHVDATKANMAALQRQHQQLQEMHRAAVEQRARGSEATKGVAQLLAPADASDAQGGDDHLAAIIEEHYALKMNLLQQQHQQSDSSSSGGADSAVVSRRLAQERDAALQGHTHLRNELGLSRAASAQAAAAAAARAESLEAQLSKLQSRMSSAQEALSERSAAAASLETQVRSLEHQLSRARGSQDGRESELSQVVSERNAALQAGSEARGEVREAAAKVSECMRTIRALEDELAATKARSEAARSALEGQVAEERARADSLAALVRSKEAQLAQQRAEFDRARSAAEMGAREVSSAVPALRRENKALQDALLQVGEGLRALHGEIRGTKAAARGVRQEFRADAAAGAGAGAGAHAGAGGDGDTDADGDTDTGELDFDINAHLSPLSPRGGRGSFGFDSGQEGEALAASAHKYPSVLGLLLADLGPLLNGHVALLRANALSGRECEALGRRARAEAGQAESDRQALHAKLRALEQDRSRAASAASQASSAAAALQAEVDELRLSCARTSRERKEYAGGYEALLSAQKAWEDERVSLRAQLDQLQRSLEAQSAEAESLNEEGESLRGQVAALARERDSLAREKDASDARVAALKGEVAKAQARERSYREKDLRASETDVELQGLQGANAGLQARLEECEAELEGRRAELRAALEQGEQLVARTADQSRSLQLLETKLSDLGSKLAQSQAAQADSVSQAARAAQTHREYVVRMKAQWDEEAAQARSEHEEALRGVRAALKAAQADLALSEARREGTEEELKGVRTALKAAQHALDQSEAQRDSLESLHAAAAAQAAQGAKALSKSESDLAEARSAVEKLQEQVRRISREAEKNLRDAAAAARDAAGEHETSLRAMQSREQALLAGKEEARREAVALQGQVEALRAERRALEMELRASQANVVALERGAAASAEQLQRAERDLALKADQLSRLERDAAARAEQLSRLERDVSLKAELAERAERERITNEKTLSERVHAAEAQARQHTESLAAAAGRAHELEGAKNNLSRSLSEAERRVGDLSAQLDSLLRDRLPRLERSLAQADQSAAERTQERDALAKRLSAAEYSSREEKMRLEFEITTARKETAALSMRVQSESDSVAQLRSAAHAQERDHASRMAQWTAEAQSRAAELSALQSAHAQLRADHDQAADRAAKVAAQLRQLSGEHDALQRAHQRATQQLQQAEASLTRAAARESECRALHEGEWQALLGRLTADLRDQCEVVALLRGELARAQSDAEQRAQEVAALQSQCARLDEEQRRGLDEWQRQRDADRAAHDSEVDQLRRENDARRAEFDAAHGATLDRLHEVSSALDQRMAELERIRSLLGLEWIELARLSEDESAALRERARALFNVEATLSIAQLHSLVKQQSLHLQDAKAENADLNAVIARLKEEMRAYQQQKLTEHSTMDKLLSANRRLQAFIEQPQQGQGHPMRSPSSMGMSASMSGLQASPTGGVMRAPTPVAAVFSASATPSRRASISAAVSPSYLSPQQRDANDPSARHHSSVAAAVPFDSTFAGAAAF